MAEKYKAELVTVTEKFEKINDYIYESRHTTIKNDIEHGKFVKEVVFKTEDIEEAKVSHTKYNYSALETDITDLKEHMKS